VIGIEVDVGTIVGEAIVVGIVTAAAGIDVVVNETGGEFISVGVVADKVVPSIFKGLTP
jgi:hypothetical protein